MVQLKIAIFSGQFAIATRNLQRNLRKTSLGGKRDKFGPNKLEIPQSATSIFQSPYFKDCHSGAKYGYYNA